MKETPMMKQYLGFKQLYPDKILLFRMGDFFETFNDDARITSKVLNITLTTRDRNSDPTPLAGFPFHALDQYLPKLVNAGYSVVIVDQVEDPKQAKGIVKRAVTQIVTPGTIDDATGERIEPQKILAFAQEGERLGIATVDINVGTIELFYVENVSSKIEEVISTEKPSEILIVKKEIDLLVSVDKPIQILENRISKEAEHVITKFYNLKSSHSLGIYDKAGLKKALALLLFYLQETQRTEVRHISKPILRDNEGVMQLDGSTIRNLELVPMPGGKASLFGVLDYTKTRMGRRLLYSWILHPLTDKAQIDRRLDMVEALLQDQENVEFLRKTMGNLADLDRIIRLLGTNRVSPVDVNNLKATLQELLNIRRVVEKLSNSNENPLFKRIISPLREEELIDKIVTLIERALKEDISLSFSRVKTQVFFKTGYNSELDKLIKLATNRKEWIEDFARKEQEKTGIPSLKIGFNKVFGYYIEVTKVHRDKVPQDRYFRKQTLTNSERYITEELKEVEETILNAESQIEILQQQLFANLVKELSRYLNLYKQISVSLALLDVLTNFAYVALMFNYVRPEIIAMGTKHSVLSINGGRHPVVERLNEEEPFIPNDTAIKTNNVAIITGPNMAGKSTYIRQVALIVLMAQMGSFVPADEAVIPVVDRVFTRIGASDDLSAGRSTFMVEMEETANILNNATANSLIILDEVGRGTSTYDGVSIAWAVSEYVIKTLKSRMLFATHYHELLGLIEKFPNEVKNYTVLVEDSDDNEIVFLRKIVEGGKNRSYGIHVGKMAGLPDPVITLANEILQIFEQENLFTKDNNGLVITKSGINKIIGTNNSSKEENHHKRPDRGDIPSEQISLFNAVDSGILQELQNLDINKMTPLDALKKLSDWKNRLGL